MMADHGGRGDNWYVGAMQRRVRIVLILNASREAGIEPLSARRLHLIAYLCNVLSPVWDLDSFVGAARRVDGAILKRGSGPFYPDMQSELDRLVGMGVALVERIRYPEVDEGKLRLEGEYRLNAERAKPIVTYLQALREEGVAAKSIRELVLALSSLTDEEIDRAAREDATYSDTTVGIDNVIDFGEWLDKNYSSAAATRAGELIGSGVPPGASEKLHLYVRHLRGRLKRVG